MTIDIICLVIQVILLVITIAIIMKFSIGKKIQHNQCYTDNLSAEFTHGNTEPHI